MRKLGLIGGTTWVSTVDYYKSINQKINNRLGGDYSAELILYSFNFAEFRYTVDDPPVMAKKLIEAAVKLENAGAEALLICANTPHMAAEEVQQKINIPLINIAVETAKAIRSKGLKSAALLGTKYTMEQPFYKNYLSQYEIKTFIPDEEEGAFIHSSIFDELGKEIFTKETKKEYLNIINRLVNAGAECAILGCTEIPLLIKQEDCSIPVFDTLEIHVEAAVNFALSE